MANRSALRPPVGLSKESAELWRVLRAEYLFAAHETPWFERALKFSALSDRLLLEADAAPPGVREKLLKLAYDANSSALRCWRVLKFTDPARPGRRLGRPADSGGHSQVAVIAQEGNGHAPR